MLRKRPKTVILLCVAIVIVLVLVPTLIATFPPAPQPYASGICQMEYADRTVAGKAGWEISSITMGPEGGKLGEHQFKPGDVIVKVGGKDVEGGDKLDLMIRMAIVEQRRTITLCDPQNGNEVLYTF